MPFQLHPFDPSKNKPRPNADGSVSTEITRTVQLPDGRWANVPSLWWGDGSSVRDFGTMSDDQLGELAARYERESGASFPRYQNLTAAESAAKARSNAGGGTQGPITGARAMPNWTPSSDLSSFYSGRMAPPIRSNGFILPAMNQPTQTATLPYPEDSRTSSPPPVPGPSQFALMNQRDRIEDKPAPQVAQAPSTVDTTNALDMSYYGLSAPTAPSTQTADNSALEAIDQLTGSGRSTAMPFPLMAFNQPRVPNVPLPRTRPDPSGLVGTGEALPGASNFDGTPVEIMVRGGNRPGAAFGGGWGSTGFALPSMNKPPSIPAPRNTGSYTIQKGDTLGSLAKRFNTTVSQLANANNIANPNKIRAGATLNLGYLAPPVPRMPPAALGRGYAQPSQSRPRETFDQIWAEARG